MQRRAGASPTPPAAAVPSRPAPEQERRLLAGCDSTQREAITTARSPLLVVAGAGSGKTRVLTRRIAWRIASGDALAEHVLALTFTRRAAAELRSRLAALGIGGTVTAGTFHAVALRELRRRALESGRRPPVVLDSKVRLLAELIAPRAAGRGRPGAPAGRELLGRLATEIEWASARMIPAERYAEAAVAAGRDSVLQPEQVASLIARYRAEKSKRGLVDFEDLLTILAGAIADEEAFAAVQRWRYRHVFVDELQDVNAAQLALLDAWLGRSEDLCAVGDSRQAIYGWNGAETDAIALFTRRFPRAQVVELATNYRSTPQVVTVAAAALGRRREAPAGAARPDGAVPTLRCYEDEAAEAAAVARALRLARRPGSRFSDCAVLARTNAQLVPVAQALRAAGIPVASAGTGSFLERPAVRRAIAELGREEGADAFSRWLADIGLALRHGRPAADPEDGDPEDGDPEGGDPEDGDPEERRPGAAGGHGAGASRRQPQDARLAPQDWLDLAALSRLGHDFAAFEPAASPAGFLGWAAASLRADPWPGSVDAVDVLSFHRAKGLEWRVVFVIGLEDGFVPIAHAATTAALEEERRLLYVALTRAVDELHCSWCTTRSFGRRRSRREPSPWLAPLESACRDLARSERADPRAARATIAAARAHLAALPPPGAAAGCGGDTPAAS